MKQVRILLILLIFCVISSHFLFLKELDYVVYDHDQRHTARPALKGYYQLEDGHIVDFLKEMFSHHEGYPRYPAFVGYLTAFICRVFGLSEVMMRFVTLIFYLILIFFTYKCAKELDSEMSGFLAVLIMATIPVTVFWSRMIFPDFFGATFFMAAFYYMLKSKNFRNLFNSFFFGLFTGFSLLTHRVMFIPLLVLWIVFTFTSFRKGFDFIKGFILSFLTALAVSGNFLFGYFKAYDSYRDLRQYSYLDFKYFKFFGMHDFLWRLRESLGQFGYDNLAIILLIILCIFFKKCKKSDAQSDFPLFGFIAISSFCLFLSIWFIVTYSSEIRLVNMRHFQVFAPMMAVMLGVYLNRGPSVLRNMTIGVKYLLLLSLLFLMLPSFGKHAKINMLKKYYYIPNTDGRGNGVIWKNRTFARKEELDYFKKEISKGDIVILDLPIWNHLVSLSDRLQFNRIGRSVSREDADLSAAYFMFYCTFLSDGASYPTHIISSDNYKNNPKLYKNLSKIERFLNNNTIIDAENNKKLSIINTYGELAHADILANYITHFNFKRTRCFEYNIDNAKMYKVIFKSNENLEALIKNEEFLCFLTVKK